VALAGRKVMYVKVRAAKLRKSIEPGRTDYVSFLPLGTRVEVAEEKEGWCRVLVPVDGAYYEGWVHKSQLSPRRPRREKTRTGGLARLLTSKEVTGVDATKGAASRQLLEGKKYAASRNLKKEYELVVGWLEHQAPSLEDLDRFMQEGHLGPYREAR